MIVYSINLSLNLDSEHSNKNQSFKLVYLKTHIILFYVLFKEKYLSHYDMYMNSYIVQRQFMNYIHNL